MKADQQQDRRLLDDYNDLWSDNPVAALFLLWVAFLCVVAFLVLAVIGGVAVLL